MRITDYLLDSADHSYFLAHSYWLHKFFLPLRIIPTLLRICLLSFLFYFMYYRYRWFVDLGLHVDASIISLLISQNLYKL
jgi:hypothetical protein